MRPLTIVCYLLFFAPIAAFVVQMWWHVWDHPMFMKLVITDGCLFAVVFVMSFLIKEHKESKNIGNDELK